MTRQVNRAQEGIMGYLPEIPTPGMITPVCLFFLQILIIRYFILGIFHGLFSEFFFVRVSFMNVSFFLSIPLRYFNFFLVYLFIYFNKPWNQVRNQRQTETNALSHPGLCSTSIAARAFSGPG